jgi:hypothetical protein
VCPRDPVDNENQLVVMVTVEHLDVDTGFGHASGQQAELSWHGLMQAHTNDVANLEHADPGKLKGAPGGCAVGKEKVRGCACTDHPGATSFDTDTGPAKRITHFGQGTGAVVEYHRYVLHARLTPSVRKEPVRSEFR